MSFIKKAVKKVFKVVKKVVKSKWFKWVAIAALTFFTAGVAAGGFAAFAGVNSIGSFFVAVGQTMATGAASMASGLGFKGAAAGLAKHGGAAAIQAGLTSTATSATGSALAANLAEGTISAVAPGSTAVGTLANRAGEGILLSAKATAAAKAGAAATLLQGAQQVSGALPGMLGTGAAEATAMASTQFAGATGTLMGTASKVGIGAMVWQGIQTGFTAAAAAKAREGAKKGPTFVAGGISHGKSDRNFGPTLSFVTNDRDTTPVGTEPAPAAPATREATLAGELARDDTENKYTELPTVQERQDTGLLAQAEGPAEMPPGLEEASPDTAGGAGIVAMAQNAPVTTDPLGNLQATPIAPRSGAPRRSPALSGIIAGV